MSIELTGAREIEIALNATVSEETKRRLLSKLSKRIADNSKKRVRAQTDLSGAAWTPRKSGKRKKMLVKIGQRIQTVSVNPNDAIIGFSNPLVRRTAAIQQYGVDQTATAAGLITGLTKNLSDSDHATVKIANFLRAIGFKVRKSNGGFKTPTKQWILENMTVGQVKAILGHQIKDSWVIKIPERSFLGIPDSELESLATIAMNELTRGINR